MVAKKKTSRKPSNERLKIKVTKNGPYIISGGIPLLENTIVTDAEGYSYQWRVGKKYPVQESCALCRCGQSRNPPFCDGTHLSVQFDGTETAGHKHYVSQAKEINGPDLDLTDAPALCVHAGFCDRAGGTWNLTLQSDDPEARKTAIKEAGDCPSGRLVVWDKKGHEIEPEFEPSIALVRDLRKKVSGPLWVRGGIAIESADGTIYEIRNRVALCRCGKSANKPFCDGSHLNKGDGVTYLLLSPSLGRC